MPHTYRVDPATARMLTINTLAGTEGFFREAGEPALTRTAPPQGPPNIGIAVVAGRGPSVIVEAGGL